MTKTELKETITKIEQLLQSENYEAGFELLKTINEPELTAGTLDAIGTILKERYFKSGEDNVVADFDKGLTIIGSLNLLKMDLSQMETISMDPVTDGYYNSRIRKAVALNTTTSKDILNALIKDDYRWVREAAASHIFVGKTEIDQLIKTGDRYVLKGLVVNQNCGKANQDKIAKLLEDKEKYPIEYTTYTITAGEEYGRIAAGEIDLDIILDAVMSLLSGESYYEDLYNVVSEVESSIFYFDNFYYEEGFVVDPSSLISTDSGDELSGLEIGYGDNDEIPDISSFTNNLKTGTFFHEIQSYYGGEFGPFTIELEYELKPDEIMANCNHGIISGYQTSNSFFESKIEVYEIDKYRDEYLYVKTEDGHTITSLADLRDEIKENVEEPNDRDAVMEYIKKTYGSQ